MPEEVAKKFGSRHFQVGLLFVMLFLSQALRVNMSLGIVAMTDTTDTRDEVNIGQDSKCGS